MLTVENVNQYYGGSHILRGISFEAAPGKVTALLGRNGVGKTTLLKALMGLVPVASGRVSFGGEDLTGAPSHRRVRAGIGYVPQGREIFPRLTVRENLLMGLASRPRTEALPERIFLLFPALEQMLGRRGGDLSGGQQQQLAIGRALAMDPSLLILDEPVAGMTDEETDRTAELIVSLAGEHSLVVVEHDMAFVAQLGGKVTVLHEGRVLTEGKLDAVQADPRVIEVYLGR